jgi:hypothetical protein
MVQRFALALTCGSHVQVEGKVAAARHLLDRGNEIIRDFECRPFEEFHLAVAYQKFEERVVQMRQVLRCVFQTDASSYDLLKLASGPKTSEAEGGNGEEEGDGAEAGGALHVLSLGGGSGNDASGVVAFLMERQGLYGVGVACSLTL